MVVINLLSLGVGGVAGEGNAGVITAVVLNPLMK
jgi:hypothetical protein